MTSQNKLVQLGEWPAVAAQASAGTYSGNLNLTTMASQGATISGTGTVQSNASALTVNTSQVADDIINVGTVNGTTNNCVQLANQGAAYITLFNGSTSTVLVFPPIGGSVNGQATNSSFGTIGSAFGVGAAKSTSFITADGLTWFGAHAG